MARRSEWSIGSTSPLLLMAPKGAVCQIVGGAISPLLANVYLHYVLDDWWFNEVLPRLPR